MNETQRGIAEFISVQFLVDLEDLEVDTPLLSSGLIDSFAMVELLLHIETVAGCRVPPADVALENLDSIGRISMFIEQLKAG